MAYVEWLRVRKTLVVLAIVLGALFLIACVVRVSVNGQMDPDNWIKMAGSQAQVTTKTLPDGATQTTILDKTDGKSTTVVDRGWYGKSIVVTDPKGESGRQHRDIVIGPVHVDRENGKTIDIDTNGPLDLGFLFSAVVLVGLIVATVLGAPLARENERLEVAWTKPIDRTLYAFQLFIADSVGIVGALVMTVIFSIAAMALFQAPHLTLSPDGGWKIALSIVAPIAWYAMYVAITSWLKRGAGGFLGLAWPVGLIVPGLALLPLEFNAVAQMFHWIFAAVAAIDPLAYVHLASGDHGPLGFAALADPLKLGILVALVVVYFVAGLIEWRRVEA